METGAQSDLYFKDHSTGSPSQESFFVLAAKRTSFRLGLPGSNPASTTYTAVPFDQFHNLSEPLGPHF